MVTPVVKSAGLVSAHDADKYAFIPRNHVRDTSIALPRWTLDGQTGGTDITHPNRPVARLYDGRLDAGSSPSDQTASTYYLNFNLNVVDLDSAFIALIDLDENFDISFQIADTADYLTNLVTIATWTGVTGTRRRAVTVRSTLYTGVVHARFRFVNTSGDNLPLVGEAFVGEKIQLSRKFDVGHDDDARGSEVRDFRSRNRAITRYVDARGFSDMEGQATPTGDDTFGLDDLATFRALYDESDGGTEAIVFFKSPNLAPNAALFGFGPPDDFRASQGPYKRVKQFSFMEQNQFQSRET